MSDTEDEVEDAEDDEEGEWTTVDTAAEEERFARLCAALRRNDPDITEISFYDCISNPYGCRLGDALQGNHYVSSMRLNIHFLLDDNNEVGTDSIECLLRYIHESEVMRKEELTGTVSLSISTFLLVRHVLVAIAANPCIEELSLWINTQIFAAAFALFCEQQSRSKHWTCLLVGLMILYRVRL